MEREETTLFEHKKKTLILTCSISMLLRSTDIQCNQEIWLFNAQLWQLGEIHKSFDCFGKTANAHIAEATWICGVATLFQKVMDLRVRKYLDGECHIVVTESPICIINVYIRRNSKTSDDYDAALLEVQEILDKFSTSHAIILLSDMHSSLLSRVNNDKDNLSNWRNSAILII